MDSQPTLEMLSAQLDALQKLVLTMSKSRTIQFGGELFDDAKHMALYSMVQDLAVKAGCPLERFEEQYRIRLAYWHQKELGHIEEDSPELAAELDSRPVDESAEGEPYEPLFPDE